MSKRVLFVVHGMGDHSLTGLNEPPNVDWHLPIRQALKNAWEAFPRLATRPLEERLEVVPITYDQVFHQQLLNWADEGRSWRELFAGTPLGAVGDFLEGMPAQDADFVSSNVLDVLMFLLPNVAQQVYLVVQEQILAAVRKHWDELGHHDTRFAMVTHSLGTAVARGALDQLSRGTGKFQPLSLRAGQFHLDGYVSVANVSQLLYRGADLYARTALRPRVGESLGYTDRFYNIHHVADPFVYPQRFGPPWRQDYACIQVAHAYDVNVHGFEHYLRNPVVTGSIFRAVFGVNAVPKSHIENASKDFRQIDAEDPAEMKALITGLGDELGHAFGAERNIKRLLVRAVSLLFKHRKQLASLGMGA